MKIKLNFMIDEPVLSKNTVDVAIEKIQKPSQCKIN